MTTLINRNQKLVLGDEAKKYRWKTYEKYEFANNDELGRTPGRLKKMGIPEEKHYGISFQKIPNGKKRKQLMVFYFNGNYEYTCLIAYCNITKKALKEIETDALNELIGMGLIKESDKQ